MEEKRFTEIYKKYADSIYRYCKFKTRTQEDAEDVVSHVFLTLYKQETVENPRAWLYTAARNRMLNMYKTLQKKNEVVMEDSALTDEADASSVQAQAHEVLLVDTLKQELHTMPETDADVITMRVWGQMSYAEIAEVISAKEATVRKQFERAVSKLKKRIAERERKLVLSSLTTPVLLAGIAKVGSLQASAVPASLTASVFNTLHITNTAMSITGTGAAGAATTASAAQAGGISALLSTTAAQVAVGVVATTAVVGGGAGIYYVTQEDEPVEEPNEIVMEEPIVEETPEEVVLEEIVIEEETEPQLTTEVISIRDLQSPYSVEVSIDVPSEVAVELDEQTAPAGDTTLVKRSYNLSFEGNSVNFYQQNGFFVGTITGEPTLLANNSQLGEIYLVTIDQNGESYITNQQISQSDSCLGGEIAAPCIDFTLESSDGAFFLAQVDEGFDTAVLSQIAESMQVTQNVDQ